MSPNNTRLADGEILSRLLSRRSIVRIGTKAALIAAPVVLGATRHAETLAQTPATSETGEDESTIYRPATPVGTAPPESTGPSETPVSPLPDEASPVAEIPIATFMGLSLALVGGGRLDDTRGAQLLALIAADSERRAALDRLLAIRAGDATATPIATPVATLSGAERDLVEQMLRFWYLGTYDGQPVTDRAGFWFGLSAWQAVEYTYAPSVCRAFGLWAQPPQT
ncbi:MAG: hypothetical protein H0T18_01175 [Chloroflexia bacterium]|nr:hypothetical protein [Chloroflexia bacterium]